MSGSCPSSGVLAWGLEWSSSGQCPVLQHPVTAGPVSPPGRTGWRLETGKGQERRRHLSAAFEIPLCPYLKGLTVLCFLLLLCSFSRIGIMTESKGITHHYLHEHWQMGAMEEAAAVLWVDMYVYIHTIWLTMHYITRRILFQQRYESHALLLHRTRKSCNKYCSGNTARRQPCI